MCSLFCRRKNAPPDEEYIILHNIYLEKCIDAAINANLAEETSNPEVFVKYSNEFALNSMCLAENIKKIPNMDINEIEIIMNIRISAATTGLKSSEYHWKLSY